jgi:hypothetical protein
LSPCIVQAPADSALGGGSCIPLCPIVSCRCPAATYVQRFSSMPAPFLFFPSHSSR